MGTCNFRGNFKGLCPSTPPLERGSFIRIDKLTIAKVTILSIPKMRVWKLSFLVDLGRVLVQGETKIIDLRLKGLPWDKNAQSMFQEATLHYRSLDCLRSRQADPQRINRRYPKEWRFLLKRYRVIVLSLRVDAPPGKSSLKTSPHNQQMLLGK